MHYADACRFLSCLVLGGKGKVWPTLDLDALGRFLQVDDRRGRGGDQLIKGGDYGPPRENNSALADQNVGGDDSANADNISLAVTQIGLLQLYKIAPGQHSKPGDPRFRTTRGRE